MGPCAWELHQVPNRFKIQSLKQEEGKSRKIIKKDIKNSTTTKMFSIDFLYTFFLVTNWTKNAPAAQAKSILA